MISYAYITKKNYKRTSSKHNHLNNHIYIHIYIDHIYIYIDHLNTILNIKGAVTDKKTHYLIC